MGKYKVGEVIKKEKKKEEKIANSTSLVRKINKLTFVDKKRNNYGTRD